jgi:mannosyl-3-phosphoglycerate phosphatase
MEEQPSNGMSGPPFLLIFTDLDGTLLDHETYDWRQAEPALRLCERLGVPVILVSSKTRAELERIQAELPLSAPFVCENGGGIFFSAKDMGAPPPGATMDRGLWKWSLGIPYELLVKAFRKMREELGWNIKGFSDMSLEEISQLTGLDKEASRFAAMREYDEPFIVMGDQEPDEEALVEAAGNMALTITRGGRFYHLQGAHNKGRAMEELVSWYQGLHGRVSSMALGDSPNDVPMLERADYPVLIRSKRDYATLKIRIPSLKITQDPGPMGWNSAVMEILKQIGG